MICVGTCHLLNLANSISKPQLSNVGLLAVENMLKVTEIVAEKSDPSRPQSLFISHYNLLTHAH